MSSTSRLRSEPDNNGNGVIDGVPGTVSSEWYGDAAGELPLAVTMWNTTGNLQPRWLRVTLVLRTSNAYQGKAPALGPYEDRSTYPSTVGGTPRYRPVRFTVAPRVWNLGN
jgi:hypothetical protein